MFANQKEEKTKGENLLLVNREGFHLLPNTDGSDLLPRHKNGNKSFLS
jgi:hypothetical protein